MVVEWMRDVLDSSTGNNAAQDGSSAAFLDTPEAEGMFMVRFTGLTANRTYYLRAKTILTVIQDEDGSVRKEYNYIVQASLTTDFLDAVTITVPPLTDITAMDPARVKRKESAWSKAVSLFTERSEGEYDGSVNPDMYPLPERDYEILYLSILASAMLELLNQHFRSMVLMIRIRVISSLECHVPKQNFKKMFINSKCQHSMHVQYR
jgi:hypothetical protein